MKPKIVHITTFQRAGSGIAAMRLHKALLQHGYDSKFLFLYKGVETATEIGYQKKIYLFDLMLRILKKLGLPLNLEQRNDYSIRKYKYQVELFSFANTPYKKLHDHPLIKEANIIHLHFISDYVDFKTFFANVHKPIIWTLHDMNPFQGGFHYKGDVMRFGSALQTLDNEQFTIKKNSLDKLPVNALTILTPSEWLMHLSEKSEMLKKFNHVCIPNCVDTNIFKISNRKNSYDGRKLNVLFVAESLHNQRKGFDYVLEILQDKKIIDACAFTAVGHVKKSSQIPVVAYTGSISSEKEMSRLYNEADIFLLPSREDNLPNAMVESLCCGTPVVGFAIGGLVETITNGENGFLSDELTADGLKAALFTCIANITKLSQTSIEQNAHAKFSSEVVVKQFSELYNYNLSLQLEESTAN